MEQKLRQYILTELAPASRGRRLEPDEPLFEAVLDSTSVLALVGFIEDEFQVEVPDSDVVPQNFSTLARLAAYVERRLAEEQRGGVPAAALG